MMVGWGLERCVGESFGGDVVYFKAVALGDRLLVLLMVERQIVDPRFSDSWQKKQTESYPFAS